MKYDNSLFKYGIEHEFPLLREGQFVDFTNTKFEDIDRLIQRMPVFESDYPGLRVGDLKIKSKRWYIEGFERFSSTGEYLYTDIKGMEIRTPIMTSIEQAVTQLTDDFEAFQDVAGEYQYQPAAIALNPFQTEYQPDPILNDWEVAHRSSPEEQTAYIHMLTYGPDVSFSHPDMTLDDIIEVGQKLTYYSPFLVPFSFSSPFFEGKLWGGLSRRTYYRTGMRPAALVFISDTSKLVISKPTLTEPARLPAENGRIEFKAFDTQSDLTMYGALLALVKGVALSDRLTGRAFVPDAALHKAVAVTGFAETDIKRQAAVALEAADEALPSTDRNLLKPLFSIHDNNLTPAHKMIQRYNETSNIMTVLEEQYGGKV